MFFNRIKEIICPVCKFSFTGKITLEDQERERTLRFTCEQCQKVFYIKISCIDYCYETTCQNCEYEPILVNGEKDILTFEDEIDIHARCKNCKESAYVPEDYFSPKRTKENR
jgi:hypothetical protein